MIGRGKHGGGQSGCAAGVAGAGAPRACAVAARQRGSGIGRLPCPYSNVFRADLLKP